MPIALATVLTDHPRGNEVERSSSFFGPAAPGHGLAEQLVLHGLLAEQTVQLAP